MLLHPVHPQGPISLSILTLFASSIDRSPNPPSGFGVHTSDHATLAFFGFRDGPDQKNAEQSLSISLIQALGRQNAAIQKFVRLKVTELKS